MRFVVPLLCCLLVGCPSPGSVDPPATNEPKSITISVTNEVLREDCLRIGVNIGGPNAYGAENYMRNMVPNPGFEPADWASVATLYAASATYRMQAKYWDTAWHTDQIGQVEHHWTDGEWELPLQGLQGRIVGFVHESVGDGSSGVTAYTWILDQSVSVNDSEPLVVRKEMPATGPAPRPGSTGRQSRYIANPGNVWQTTASLYLDTLARHGTGGDGDCGALRVLRGPHDLRFWAKGPASVEFSVSRGGTVLVAEQFTLPATWKSFESTIDLDEAYQSGDAPPLEIGWKVLKGDGFYLDDLFFGPSGDGAFADELVDALRFLRPGVIRGWQGFHGDSLANLLADEFARGPRDYRPRARTAGAWGYGIPDLLDLCQTVDAAPWIVFPPTLSDEDMAELGDYLRERTDEFATIYVEFGNEAWGSNNPYDDPFAGGGFVGGANLGAVAHAKFAAMGDVPGVVAMIGGQAAWAGQNEAIREVAGDGYSIPVAPYFGALNDRYDTPADMFYPLFARPYEDTTTGKLRQNESLANAIYEINFHTTGGAGGDKARVNEFVAGEAGGIALPLYCLNYMREFGWAPQAAFTLAQYSAGGVRIWGIYRDIMATGRPRPTALGLALANRAIEGDMVRVDVTGAPAVDVPAVNGLEHPVQLATVDAFAWRNGDEWSVMLFNLSVDQPYTIDLSGLVPEEAWVLTAADPLLTNEDNENVRLESTTWLGIIPAHSAMVLHGRN